MSVPKRVFFSASQQNSNTYHCKTTYEREYCESLVDLIIERLPESITGYCNHSLLYSQRPSLAKQLGADIYITIHTNGFNGAARGLEIGTSGSKQDQPLAEAIYNVLEPLTPFDKDRGIKKYSFVEAVQPIMPSCYIEVSFHDNHEDEQWLLNNKVQIADGIIKGICTYLGIAIDKPKPVPPIQDTVPIEEYQKLVKRAEEAEYKLTAIRKLIG